MQLHQLLRFVNKKVPIVILDVEGIEICRVQSKDDIHVDLYEYHLLEIAVGLMVGNNQYYGLCITIQK